MESASTSKYPTSNRVEFTTENNNIYQIEVNVIEDKVEIVALDPNEFGATVYRTDLTLTEIKKIHKFFKIIEDLEDFKNFILSATENKEIKITKETQKMVLEVLASSLKQKEWIRFFLKKEENNSEGVIRQLVEEVKSLKYENQTIKDDIEKYLEITAKTQQDLNETKETLFKIGEYLAKMKESFDKFFGNPQLMMSCIFTDQKEIEFLKDCLKLKTNKEPKRFRKLYSASRDGDLVQTFHNKCDNFPNTLVLIKTPENYKFGGFTTVKWSSPPSTTQWKKDPSTFLFSLTKFKIYHCIENTEVIECNPKFGPCFGRGNDICIRENCMHAENGAFQKSYEYKGKVNDLIGSDRFRVFDYEVFEVIF